MVSLILRHGQHYPQVSTQGTHTIDVASGTLPARIAVLTVCHLRERFGHIIIQLLVLLEVQLESIVMALGVRIVFVSMSFLGPASDY